MAKKIEIIDNSFASNDVHIEVGEQTTGLLARQKRLSPEEEERVISEAQDLLSQCCNPVGGKSSNTGLAIGYVQSGKTLSFTTLTALAKDNGYRMVIILAGIGNNLLQQTTNRIRKDLLTEDENSLEFKVYENPNIEGRSHKSISKTLRLNDKPLIIVTILKHYKRIKELTNILISREVKEQLREGAVLIIDDEADQASLNTLAKKNSKSADWEDAEFSSTYGSIVELREAIDNHTFVQYTATPQAPLLISLIDFLSPDFHRILTPGNSYTGGKVFFIDNDKLYQFIPEKEVYHHKDNPLSAPPESLKKALRIYFIGAAIQVKVLKNTRQVSMMVHADREKDASKKFFNWIEKITDSWSDILSSPDGDPSKREFIEILRKDFEDAVKILNEDIDFEKVIEEIEQIILDTNLELVIEKKNEIPWGNNASHILVGADKLNRGFTVEGLMVTYMPRYSKGKSNADTIQQRCRFFGYKANILKSCRVFLPADSISEYREYVNHEEALRAGLKNQSLKEYKKLMILDDSMRPTRNNILSDNLVKNKMTKWKQFNSIKKSENNTSLFDKLLEEKKKDLLLTSDYFNYGDVLSPTRNHLFSEISYDEALQLISDYEVTTVSDIMRKQATIQYLAHWKKEGTKKCHIVFMSHKVKEGRERTIIKKGNDYKINNIWSGPDGKNKKHYPGDKAIKFPDSVTIQIHLIKAKEPSPNDKAFYTIGINYPEEMALSFISTKERFE